MDILKANDRHLAAILSLSRLATGRDDQADRLRHTIALGEVRVALADRLVRSYLTLSRALHLDQSVRPGRAAIF